MRKIEEYDIIIQKNGEREEENVHNKDRRGFEIGIMNDRKERENDTKERYKRKRNHWRVRVRYRYNTKMGWMKRKARRKVENKGRQGRKVWDKR